MSCPDYALGMTFDTKFTTRQFSTGTPFTLAGTPTIAAYPDNSTTEVTAGITLTVDFDARTGLHNIRVVATGANGYAVGSYYALVITAGTVDGVSVVGEKVGEFTIEKQSALRPVTDGRELVVDAAGLADANTVKVGPTAAGTAQTAGDIMADTNDIQTRLPATLVGGRMDSSVGAMSAAGVQAIWDALTSALTVAGSIGKRLADNIDATISSRSSHSAADVWAAGTRTLTSFGTLVSDVWASGTRTLTSLGTSLVQEIWDRATSALITGGSIGKLLVDNINATISSRLASAGYTTPDNATIASIQADTDDIQSRLPAALTGAGNLKADAQVVSDKTGYSVGAGGIGAAAFAAGAVDAAAIAANAIGASELAQDAAQEIADEVLNRDIAGSASGGARNVRSALRALRNRRAIAGGSLTVYQEDDATSGWTAVVTTTAGNPVSEIDPA